MLIRTAHLQAYRSDEALDRTTNRGIVIDNKNDGSGSLMKHQRQSMGRVNSNSVPVGLGTIPGGPHGTLLWNG